MPRKKPASARIVERNIKAMIEHQQQLELSKSRGEQVADTVTRFAGSMTFVYVHLLLYSFWAVGRTGWLHGVRGPSLTVLATFTSFEAIFLSTFILISQNRMQVLADRRAELSLHVSLLSEHEVTGLIKLVRSIARHLEITEAETAELDELAQDIHPERVLNDMERIGKDLGQPEAI